MLLQLLEPLVDLLVGDLDVHLLGHLLELGAPDEVLEALGLQVLVLGRAGLGEVALLLLRARPRLGDQSVELLLRDLLVADDRDGVLRHVLGGAVAAAATGESEGGEYGREREYRPGRLS